MGKRDAVKNLLLRRKAAQVKVWGSQEDTTLPASSAVLWSSPSKCGYLSKKGHVVKNWKNRWFVLQERCLFYFESKLYQSSDAPLGCLSLLYCTTGRLFGLSRQNCFEVCSPFSTKTYIMSASSEDEAAEWMEAISAASQPHLGRPTSFVHEKGIAHDPTTGQKQIVVKGVVQANSGNASPRWYDPRKDCPAGTQATDTAAAAGASPYQPRTLYHIAESGQPPTATSHSFRGTYTDFRWQFQLSNETAPAEPADMGRQHPLLEYRDPAKFNALVHPQGEGAQTPPVAAAGLLAAAPHQPTGASGREDGGWGNWLASHVTKLATQLDIGDPESAEGPDWKAAVQREELILNVQATVDTFFHYFSAAPNDQRKAVLGDDTQSVAILRMVRGNLCTCLASAMDFGFRFQRLWGEYHLWDFLAAAAAEAKVVFFKKLVDDIEEVEDMRDDKNKKFRSFVCAALNFQRLDEVVLLAASTPSCEKFYEPFSIMRTPPALSSLEYYLRALGRFPFSLTVLYECKDRGTRAKMNAYSQQTHTPQPAPAPAQTRLALTHTNSLIRLPARAVTPHASAAGHVAAHAPASCLPPQPGPLAPPPLQAPSTAFPVCASPTEPHHRRSKSDTPAVNLPASAPPAPPQYGGRAARKPSLSIYGDLAK